MALHINLLHERLQERAERRSDPLRIGVLGLLVVAILLVSYYMVQSTRFSSLRGELSALESEWAEKEPLMVTAREQELVFRNEIGAADALIAWASTRFYWGHLLEDILKTIPREIQITTINAGADRSEGNFTLTVGGLSAGDQPRQVAEDLRQAMIARLRGRYSNVSAEYRSLEDDPTRVNLDGRTLGTARFLIEIRGVYLKIEPAKTQ